MRRVPWITLGLAALAVIIHASPTLTAWAELDRAAPGRGEVWRLFTGHLAHFGADHLRWDALALLILGTLGEPPDRRVFAATLAGSALAIGIAVWAFQPRFAVYRGLSGLDSALFGLVCARQIADGRRAGHAFSIWVGGLALLGFGLKCVFEFRADTTIFATGAGFAPVPLAHLVGVVFGAILPLALPKPDGPPPRPVSLARKSLATAGLYLSSKASTRSRE